MPLTAEMALDVLRDAFQEMTGSQDASCIAAPNLVKEMSFDSLELLEFLMLVEERTGVEVTSDDATYETNFGELANLISRKAA